MASQLFTMVVKVRCSSCMQKLDIECRQCDYVKYRNVNNLIRFLNFINQKFPTWIFWNVYKKAKKGDQGKKVECYKNGREKHLPSTATELNHT